MKITYRIPTKDPYAYIEVESDTVDGLEPRSLITVAKNYYDYTRTFKEEKQGLSQKDFNVVLDKLWKNEGFTEEELAGMNDYQLAFYKDFRNTRNRAKSEKK